jgi:iron complex transport system substrate-binding protein
MEPGGDGHHEALHFHHPPKRVVSLVPSLTESMFDLGLGSSVVGITDYCIHPAEDVVNLPHLGGPKAPRIDDILSLKPDLVLANWEENTSQAIEALETAGISVWTSFPRTVRESLDVLWILVGLFHNQVSAARLETLELTLDWATSSMIERRPLLCFCPIWYEKSSEGSPWWMTFNRHTYCHDLLHLLGCQNIFAERERCYPIEADLGQSQPEAPGSRDTRYPRVVLSEIRAAKPDVILLPSEPFEFNDTHRLDLIEQLADVPAVEHGHIFLVDGSLITWHGTRLAHALRELPTLLDCCQ